MASTSVHIPPDLLRRLDRVAKVRRMSRNRLIVEACRSLLGEGQEDWPDGFFAGERLSDGDRALLRSTFDDWMAQLGRARRSKQAPPF